MTLKLRYHVSPGTKLSVSDQDFLLFPESNGDYRAKNLETGRAEVWTLVEFLAKSGQADALRSELTSSGTSSAAHIRRGGLVHRDQLTKPERDVLRFRKALMCGIETLVQAGIVPSGANLDRREHRTLIKEIAGRVYTDKPIGIAPRGGGISQVATMPKGRTLKLYWTRYVDANFDEMALVDQSWLRGNRKPRIHWRVRELIDQAIEDIYLDLKDPRVSAVLRRLETLVVFENEKRRSIGQDPLHPVSHKTISAHIAKISPTALAIARNGERAAANSQTRGRTDTRALMIGEEVEIDECKLSLMTPIRRFGWWEKLSQDERTALQEIEDFIQARLWLVLVIDVASRMPLGWTLTDAPSHKATLEALRMATRSKEREKVIYGCDCDPMPPVGLACVRNDNGSGLRNAQVKSALLGTKSQIIDVRTYHSNDKPYVERMFGTMESQLINLIHGYTGRAAGHLKGYDATKNAALLREELYGLITRYLIDEYPNEVHYGTTMFGRTPLQAAQQLAEAGWAIAPPSPQNRRLHFGWRKEATVTHNGVVVFGLPFNSPKLQQICDGRAGKVAVYCDPDCTNEATIIVEGHADPIAADLSWSEMRDMTIPEFLAHYEAMRAQDPSDLRNARERLAHLRQERFEFLRQKAIESGLPRSFMSLDEALKKAEVLTTGMHGYAPAIMPGTIAPGNLANIGDDPNACEIGEGFHPAVDGSLTTETETDLPAIMGRPSSDGCLE